ncbi:hypothetical protein [Microbispora sp. NPDC049125]|uniref:hypothetical protein n=1 Tax=Microbispora sp. NPDC049125 TaxID=3154929 RepID=UPI0034661950
MLAVASLGVSACTSDDTPTASEAGRTLKNHILQLLKERNAQNVTITDPGGKNIPCGDGHAKQTFAARGDDLPERQPAALVDALVGALKRVAPYRVVSAGESGQPVRVEDKQAHTVLVLSAPLKGMYQVSGETQCLVS